MEPLGFAALVEQDQLSSKDQVGIKREALAFTWAPAPSQLEPGGPGEPHRLVLPLRPFSWCQCHERFRWHCPPPKLLPRESVFLCV